MPKFYLISTGDYSTFQSISTQEMCVVLANEVNSSEIIEAKELVARVNNRDVNEIIVQPIGKPI